MFRRKDYFQNEVPQERSEIADLVIKIISDIIITERECEELKITLAENIRFDISDAFRTIDYNTKGYIYPEDLYKFMSKNTYQISIKMCNFLVHTITNGQESITYKCFLEFLVPRYDKDAAMQCIARKCYALNSSNKLSFFLEEFVAKLIYRELQYFEQLEVEKMKLAQMCEWKFMTVFKLVTKNENIESIDQKILNQFLLGFGREKLTDRDYLFFMTRFNRNNDKLIQRDEFNDAIFPNGFLLQSNQKDEKDEFESYIKPGSDKLDKYLGKNKMNEIDDEEVHFRPEDHQVKVNLNQKQFLNVVEDNSQRKYLSMDPHLKSSDQKPYLPVLLKASSKGNYIDQMDPNSSLKYFNIPIRQRFGSNYSTRQNQNESPFQPPTVQKLNQLPEQQYVKIEQQNQPDLLAQFTLGNKGNALDRQSNAYQQPKPAYLQSSKPQQYGQPPKLKNSNHFASNLEDDPITQSQLHNYINQQSNKQAFLNKK